MTLEEDIAILKKMERYDEDRKDSEYNDDVEHNHAVADEIIIKYIPKELAEAYDEVRKWYA